MKTKVIYLGGPSFLLEIGHFRILSDPGLDPQGTSKLEGPGHLLTKVMEPPIPANKMGKIDLVLLSHSQHLDNLDNEGRKVASKAGLILTTPESVAGGLEGNAVGLKTWESYDVKNEFGEVIKVTAMPGVHTSNPDLRPIIGEVTGFMLEWKGQTKGAFYMSGDTVFIDELKDIAKKYKIGAAILHLGAANVPAVGDNILTMSSDDGVKTVKLMNIPHVYPAHFEGWRHFSQGSWYIDRAFEAAGITNVLHLLKPGEAADVDI